MTIDGALVSSSAPFLVLATQNPIEYEGTYPLPEAQLDRFLLRTGFGYPAADAEWEMLARRLERRDRRGRAPPRRRPRDAARDAGRGRGRARDESGGPLHRRPRRGDARGPERLGGLEPARSLALVKLSRCRAALAGRDFVTPDDVKDVAVPALAHRLVLRPELWVQRRSGEDVVREILDQVRTPATETA